MTDSAPGLPPTVLQQVDALLARSSDPLAPLFDCVAQAMTEALADPAITLQLTLAIDADERRAAVAALMPRIRARALQLFHCAQEASGQ